MNNIKYEIVKEALLHVKKYEVTEVKPLIKGFSNDEKYLVKLKNGLLILMKVSDINDRDRKKQEFEYLKVHYTNGVKCSKPLDFFIMESFNACISILTYLDGESGEEVLPSLSKDVQYTIGYQAAKELKKIHEVKLLEAFDWYKKRWKKYETKKKQVLDLGYRFYMQDEIENYIEENFKILRDSPVSFQHDDFQPMNIIIKNEKLVGIIDFNRFSWGDPIEDFFKIPKYTNEISIPFSKGQVDGYFSNDIPDEFWKKYNLFVALNFHASMLGEYSDLQMERIRQRQINIFKTHDFKMHGAPDWYVNK